MAGASRQALLARHFLWKAPTPTPPTVNLTVKRRLLRLPSVTLHIITSHHYAPDLVGECAVTLKAVIVFPFFLFRCIFSHFSHSFFSSLCTSTCRRWLSIVNIFQLFTNPFSHHYEPDWCDWFFLNVFLLTLHINSSHHYAADRVRPHFESNYTTAANHSNKPLQVPPNWIKTNIESNIRTNIETKISKKI